MREPASKLIDHIISFLHDSPQDWPACALVSRSCVYAAQSHIFRRIDLLSRPRATNELRWARFLEGHIAALYSTRTATRCQLWRFQVSRESFFAVCTFPFRHLDGVWFIVPDLAPSDALALQHLLNCPTLCHVRIYCTTGEPLAFWQIWGRCSANVKHLELAGRCRTTHQFRPTPSSSSVRLASLDLREPVGDDLPDWLMHPYCPFDLSALKALSIGTNIELLGFRKFWPALQTIETLELEPDANKPIIDLSSFPSLELLRIYDSAWPWIFATLSTITPSSRIRKIVIDGDLNDTTPDEFDLHLACLPISITVEFEMHSAPYAV
ncbi:hypothetical protein C8R44DRAFT_818508 [Mycena epipterygia]|nr:hypothetical protein C8R44DRAFT_818508 [Mycena epipterygia]